MAAERPQADWRQLPESELLEMRIRDLGLRIEGSALQGMIERLYQELAANGLAFRPPCYLADEWLCPDKVPIIGIPFYLADRRLKRLEQKIMYEVEGGTERRCMQLLRHECGHAINYAYEFFKRSRWRQLFGRFSQRYSDNYAYRPYSRRFVSHLTDHYAQSHPDEDFAETFAVWLTPGSAWREKYRTWPVIKKLRYVDRAMSKIGDSPPKVIATERHVPWSAARMTSTLGSFYERRQRVLGTEFRGYYDDSLRELFSRRPDEPNVCKAAHLLRENRRLIVDNVTRWTGHRKYDIHQWVNRLAARCNEMRLYGAPDKAESIVGLTALLTALASNTYPETRRP